MELSEIRQNLDRIDQQLLALFLERMELVEQVAEFKKDQNRPIYDPTRERAILARVHEHAGDMYGASAHQFFQMIMELSRAQQAERLMHRTTVAARAAELLANEQTLFPQAGRIAICGIEGSNGQVAADRLFPRGDLVCFDRFAAVAEAVKAGLCQFGVLPVENSNNGSVRAVYDLLRDPELSIIRSLRLMIRHVLLTQPNVQLSQIRTIYSHEQAIGQCNHFLSGLSNVDVVPCQSTAHAAKRVAEAHDPTIAAIAAEDCAKLYGLSILSDDIQNQQHNDTRFWCITRGASSYAGADRISLTLSVANKSGALFQVIAKIAALGINMTKLESVPIQGSNFSYRFYVDLEASLHQPGVLGLLSELEQGCDTFRLLGNYAEIAG